MTFRSTPTGDLTPIRPQASVSKRSNISSKSTINEDENMLASAVNRAGSIAYTKSTRNGATCYQPTSCKHRLAILDSYFVLTSLNEAGGG